MLSPAEDVFLMVTISVSIVVLWQRLPCSFSRQSVGLLIAFVAGVSWNMHLEDEEEGEGE